MDQNWNDVSAAKDQATNAAVSANDFSAKGNVLVDELRKAVGERFGESGIAQDTAKARTDFMAAAPKAREDVLGLVNSGAILSPTQQAAIMAAKRSSALMPLMGANLIQDATFGTMNDIINAGTHAYQAETQNRQGLAQIAQNNYNNTLNELMQRAQLAESQKPKTTIWDDASGQSWLVNATTGEKLSHLGATYHAPTAASQMDDRATLNSILSRNPENGPQSQFGQWVNSNGQTWTDTTKEPVGTINVNGRQMTQYTDGSVGPTIWQYKSL